MVRDMAKYAASLVLHEKWQKDYFEVLKKKKLERAAYWKKLGDMEKSDRLVKDAVGMRFQFDRNEAAINYGECNKLNKPVSFIPNTCQIETQGCFENRKAIKP